MIVYLQLIPAYIVMHTCMLYLLQYNHPTSGQTCVQGRVALLYEGIRRAESRLLAGVKSFQGLLDCDVEDDMNAKPSQDNSLLCEEGCFSDIETEDFEEDT